MRFRWEGQVCDLLGGLEREADAGEVEAFYTRSPFPGYAPEDDGPRLLDRSRRSDFLRALDESIPADARVLDVGCGTGQLSAFLALAGPGREVFGLDGCRASLDLADEFRDRVQARGLHFVRGDLFAMPFPPESFDVVVSRGVCHHTPDPTRAIEEITRPVRVGGGLVLGFYETAARLAHVLRRSLWRKSGARGPLFDPVLRR
ncbi:MAG: class I SAM-dependent methyltransferase, partial [Planctomycetota bacterium]